MVWFMDIKSQDIVAGDGEQSRKKPIRAFNML